MSEDAGLGSGLGRGGKGAAGGGRGRVERKLINAPKCYPILDLGFEGKRWGPKGSVCASSECGPFARVWGQGFRDFWQP